MKILFHRVHITLGLIITLFFSLTAVASHAANLVQLSDLQYLGAFRLPSEFDFGGGALEFNPSNNSLLVSDRNDQSAEVLIPALVNSSNTNNLNTATVLQPLRDILEGKRNQVNPSDPNAHNIGGHFLYSGKLYVTVYSYYDGAGTQTTSHFVRPLKFTTTGQVGGPYRVGTQFPAFVAGYMTLIPLEWQSQLGGPALSGMCCLSILSLQSNGPAASVFNPSNLGVVAPVPATPIVGYPAGLQLGPGWETQNPLFNGTSRVGGIVFPVGTRSLLFFGRHGTGPFCYGDGGPCGDPVDGSKGTHAYPYKFQIWAYDVNDLVAVKNGTKQQWEITPYGVWNPTLPFGDPNNMSIVGAAYDAQTNRIYTSAHVCDSNSCVPFIHVFKISGSTPPSSLPPAPNTLEVQ